MKYIIVDIESDGPVPGDYSMLSLGACTLDEPEETWYGTMKPLEGAKFLSKAVDFLRENGLDRDELVAVALPAFMVIHEFKGWLTKVAKGDRLRFVADNAGFDWMFVAWYLQHFVDDNPFGFSPLSITSLYAGISGDVKRSSEYKKKYRTVKHTHNALDDARGNAGALRTLANKGLIRL